MKILLSVLFFLGVLTGLSSGQSSFFKLLNRAFYGETRAVCFDSAYSQAFSIAGNTLVCYQKTDTLYKEKFYLDFSNDFLYSVKRYPGIDDSLLFVLGQKRLYKIVVCTDRFELKTSLPLQASPGSSVGAGDMMAVDYNRLALSLGDRVQIYDLKASWQPSLAATLEPGGNVGAVALGQGLIFVSVLKDGLHQIVALDTATYQSVMQIDLSPAEMYDRPVAHLTLANNRLYLLVSSKLFEIDPSDPDHPVIKSRPLNAYGALSNIVVLNHRLFLYDWNSEQINVYDLTDSLSTNLLFSYRSMDPLWDVAVNAAQDDELLTTAGVLGIRVFKTDTVGGSQLFAASTPSAAYLNDIKTMGKDLFLSDWQLGLIVAGNSFNFLSRVGKGGKRFTIHPENPAVGYLSVGAYSWGGLYVVDLSRKNAVDSVNYYDAGGWSVDFLIHSRYGYLLSANQNAVLIFDLSEPRKPQYVNRVDVPGDPRKLVIGKNDVGFIAFDNVARDGGLLSLDFSDPRQPVALDTLLGGVASISDVALFKRYAVLLGFHHELGFVDVSDPTRLSLVNISKLAHGRSIAIWGNFAFIGGLGGINALDIKNVMNPRPAGEFRLFGGNYFPGGPSNIAEALYLADDTLYVAGGPSGLYVLKVDTTVVNLETGAARPPETFQLMQNFPNPFNSTTQIAFVLNRGEFVTLTLYDVRGRKIKTVVKGFLPPGEHRFKIDAGNLTSGIYLYCLRAGQFPCARKMVLLK